VDIAILDSIGKEKTTFLPSFHARRLFSFEFGQRCQQKGKVLIRFLIEPGCRRVGETENP